VHHADGGRARYRPGPSRAATPIGPTDTTGDLHDRLAALGATLIVEALARLPDLTPEPQPEDGVTYAAKIDKAEAAIDWTRRARDRPPDPRPLALSGRLDDA
jgi:hypothetical protein